MTTLPMVNPNPYPNVWNTMARSWYNPSVAVIMDPSGPRRAREAPRTERMVVCATTRMLEQNAEVIKT